MKIHGVTRSRTLIDPMFDLGICTSYDRLLSLSAELAYSVCARFESDNIVCPPKFKDGLFTTGGIEHIDHNPNSTSAKGSFYGTAISLQHPTREVSGNERPMVTLDTGCPVHNSSKRIAQLPSK